MNFLPTVANNIPDWMYVLFAGVLGLFVLILLVAAISSLTPMSLSWLVEPALIGYIFFLLIWFFVSTFQYTVNARAHEANLQNNLLQKYDIISVDYDSKLTPLDITESESQIITVILKDDKKGNFLLVQDARTNEPTLSELPDSTVSLEEITR